MKKCLLILLLIFLCTTWSCLIQKGKIRSLDRFQNTGTIIPDDSLSIIIVPEAEDGNAEAGYKYLVEGNAFSTGIPIGIYKVMDHAKNSKLAKIAGFNKFTTNDFVIFKNNNGQLTATSGCLHCHAQRFNNKLVIGLGNSYSNFQSNPGLYLKLIEGVIKIRYGKNSPQWKTAEMAFEAEHVLQKKNSNTNAGPYSCSEDCRSDGCTS